ncbi:hypothetical protein PoB_003717300 [Plakobranchus ocellatus]|uniref:Uncharacterized protein n=1 Tax=Plakobranchus ocellatus TaxID=259542 RepID=A0AAV4AV14_9GAST|nr:hypothetical protein PoB_003717300 [Plakobranchus ocellatus]
MSGQIKKADDNTAACSSDPFEFHRAFMVTERQISQQNKKRKVHTYDAKVEVQDHDYGNATGKTYVTTMQSHYEAKDSSSCIVM